MKSKAAVLTAIQSPLEIQEFPVQTELAPGEARVRVAMAGICGTDIHLWKGELPIPLPNILGHETVGVIEQLGTGLDKDWRGERLRIGDRVTWASSVVCGECFYCRVKKQPTRCLSRKAYGISYCTNDAPHLRGGYAEQILLRAGTAIFRLPDDLPTEAVVGAGCALSTAIHGIERSPVSWGDTVVVQGSGPVGLAALAVAKQSGAFRTIVIGGPSHRLQIAKSFGADIVIPYDPEQSAEDLTQEVLESTGPYGADVVIECVGIPQAVSEGVNFCRDGGRYLVLGQYANAGEILFNPHIITRKQLQLIGSWGFEPRHVDQALRLLELTHWQEQFAGQITHRFRLDQVNQAMNTVRNWQSGKAVLIP